MKMIDVVGTSQIKTIEKEMKKHELALNMTDLLLEMDINYDKVLSYIINSRCSRIYIGSYSCSRYFLESVQYYQETLESLAMQYHWHITLVVPVVSQLDWASTVRCLASVIMTENRIDEIVVNDYGMLQTVRQQKEDGSFKIIAGRLFHRNFRDGRYSEYTQTQVSIYDFPMLIDIKAMELDLTNSYMDCSGLSPDIDIYIHYPYTLATCGYTCEFFSSNLPTAVRFRSDTNCSLECRNCYMQILGDGCSWKQVGRAIYADNPELISCNRQISRYIYWPLEEVMM